MLALHSYWAYLLVFMWIAAVANAFSGFRNQKEYQSKDLLLGLSTLIFAHIQLFIGLSWYFMSPVFKAMQAVGVAEIVANPGSRFLALEHPLTMLFAVVLLTLGWSRHKKTDNSNAKFKTIAIFYGIALFFVILRIPWKQWLFN
jgi:hypothetical protein